MFKNILFNETSMRKPVKVEHEKRQVMERIVTLLTNHVRGVSLEESMYREELDNLSIQVSI